MNAYKVVLLFVLVALVIRLERMATRFATEGERTKALVFLWVAGFCIFAGAIAFLFLRH